MGSALAGLLLSARHHHKQPPSPRVTHASPMSQGKNKKPVRGLPVRTTANRKKEEQEGGGGVEDRARFEGVGKGGRAKTSTCKRLRREQGKLQNCRGTAFGRRYMDRRLGGGNVPTRYAGGLRPVVCERRRSTWHRLVNTHTMGSWEGSAAARALSGPEQGGLVSVKQAQQWCWMALEVNYT